MQIAVVPAFPQSVLKPIPADISTALIYAAAFETRSLEFLRFPPRSQYAVAQKSDRENQSTAAITPAADCAQLHAQVDTTEPDRSTMERIETARFPSENAVTWMFNSVGTSRTSCESPVLPVADRLPIRPNRAPQTIVVASDRNHHNEAQTKTVRERCADCRCRADRQSSA